jgi:hypothetical protein
VVRGVGSRAGRGRATCHPRCARSRTVLVDLQRWSTLSGSPGHQPRGHRLDRAGDPHPRQGRPCTRDVLFAARLTLPGRLCEATRRANGRSPVHHGRARPARHAAPT